MASVSTAKVWPYTPLNTYGDGLGDVYPWEVHKFVCKSHATINIYRTVGNLLILESTVWYLKVKVYGKVKVEDDHAIWDVEVEVEDNIEVNLDAKIDKYGTRKNRNIFLYPTIKVVYRIVMSDLLVKVADTDLLDMEEVRRVLTEDIESQIYLIWYLNPPPSPIPPRRDSEMNPPIFWGSFRYWGWYTPPPPPWPYRPSKDMGRYGTHIPCCHTLRLGTYPVTGSVRGIFLWSIWNW